MTAEPARLTAARTALTVLVGGARLARHVKNPHPLAFPLHTAVMRAIADIHLPYEKRMGAYCRLLGVMSCIEAIEHPAGGKLMELAGLVQGILATESGAWIFANQENAERIATAAQTDTAEACPGGCSLSYGEGTKEDPDRCVQCGGLFLRDADKPFAFA